MLNSINKRTQARFGSSPVLALALVLGVAVPGAKLAAHAPMDTIVGHHQHGAGAGEPVRVRDVMVEDAHLADVQFLPKADLSQATFLGADLSGAVLDGVNLRGATFLAVKLSNAKLQGADLSGAEFRRGQWEDTDFSGAVLGAATFSKVWMERPDFRNTDRTTATFLRCRVIDALETSDPAESGTAEPKAAGAGAGPAAAGAGAGQAAAGSALPPPASERNEERKAPARAKETAADPPVTVRERKWEANFNAFQDFVDRKPGVAVPYCLEGKKNPLSAWLTKRRAEFKKKTMPAGRRSRFEALYQRYQDGLDGEAPRAGAGAGPAGEGTLTAWDRLWQETCDEFETFLDEQPDVAVPRRAAGKDNPLSNWVNKQKAMLKDGTLEAWRRERFEPLLKRYPGGLPVREAQTRAGAGASPARAVATRLPAVPAGGSSPARPPAEPVESKGAGSGTAKLPALSAKKQESRLPAGRKDAADQAWELKYHEVEAFMAKHPGQRTPNPGAGKKGPLTTWMVNTRARIKNGTETTPSRIERFKKLDAKYQAGLARS
jgi:hypothetical protein